MYCAVSELKNKRHFIHPASQELQTQLQLKVQVLLICRTSGLGGGGGGITPLSYWEMQIYWCFLSGYRSTANKWDAAQRKKEKRKPWPWNKLLPLLRPQWCVCHVWDWILRSIDCRGLRLTSVTGQVLVLGDPRRSGETLGRLPVTLADEHLTCVVVLWGGERAQGG